MMKKMFCFLFGIMFLSNVCNGILMEILHSDFSFIVDTKNNTAILRHIYIPAHTKKVIEIPQFVEDYKGDRYIVRDIQEDAVKKVIHRIESVTLPNTLRETDENKKALNWFAIYDLPITINCTPLEK